MRAIKTLLVASQPVAQATSTRSRSPRLGSCLEHRSLSNGLTVYRLFGGHAATGGQPWQIVCGWPLVRRGQSRTVAVEATPGDHEGRHWDLYHDVMAKSSSLVSRAAVRGLIDQKLGGDIVHLSPKRTRPPRQQLGRENRQLTGVCGASIPFRTHPVRGRGKVPPREKAEKHGREKNSEGARPCTPDAVQEARVQRA